jgi:single-stranded-DNA-specific exonuclease
MMNGKEAVDLLLANDIAGRHASKARTSTNTNEDRRVSLDKKITDEAVEFIDSQIDLKYNNSNCYFMMKTGTGNCGNCSLAAYREIFFALAIVLTKSNGMISGSARSVPGFDMYRLLKHAAICC